MSYDSRSVEKLTIQQWNDPVGLIYSPTHQQVMQASERITLASRSEWVSRGSAELIRILWCKPEDWPKTGTRHMGLLEIDDGLPEVFVSERYFDSGEVVRLHEAEWQWLAEYGVVLKINETVPIKEE
jgi:hypothetical protein